MAGVLKMHAQPFAISVKRTRDTSVIEFKDTDGKVSKALDVETFNPYKAGVAALKNETSGYISTEGLVSNITKAGGAIAYHRVVYSKDRVQLQDLGESKLVVFNKLGNEVFRKTIDADNVHDP